MMNIMNTLEFLKPILKKANRFATFKEANAKAVLINNDFVSYVPRFVPEFEEYILEVRDTTSGLLIGCYCTKAI